MQQPSISEQSGYAGPSTRQEQDRYIPPGFTIERQGMSSCACSSSCFDAACLLVMLSTHTLYAKAVICGEHDPLTCCNQNTGNRMCRFK